MADELSQLYEIETKARHLCEAITASPEKWLVEMPTRTFERYQALARLLDLLDQKEQSTDES